MVDHQLDVRSLRKPDKHPAIDTVALSTGALSTGALSTGELSTGAADATGVIWQLQMRERDLDSNVIALSPGATIDAHAGPDVDVLIHVLAGSGQLGTELDTLALRPGALTWLPRRSRRQFTAGPDGLKYLTVHQRRQALSLTPGPVRT